MSDKNCPLCNGRISDLTGECRCIGKAHAPFIKIAAERSYRTPSHFPTDYDARKKIPIMTGVLDYFPDAIAAVAEVSRLGNEQHNPGEPLHWARGKSTDHLNTTVRHMIERGGRDTDGGRHLAKAAWRVLAALQEEIEAEHTAPTEEPSRQALDAQKSEIQTALAREGLIHDRPKPSPTNADWCEHGRTWTADCISCGRPRTGIAK